ncbi:MAG: 50S ribosomal protein L10 [Sulfurovum sp. PC08-66]|nr:MAG: 50S ribosomal protein L10 [Sulfurovum sp. PC08-66]KIM12524.1 MAG: 50S ribosomal protein L10 [Sulfuricurvum sp. PC08-66]
MTRSNKQVIIDALTAEFKSASAIVACDFKGLTVKEIEALRKLARSSSAKVKVVKNTLATIALANAGVEGLALHENNVFVWGDEPIGAAKVVFNFAKENDKFVIKNGVIDGKVADAKTVEAFAKLPGREELLGMLASVWMGPVRNFTIGLDALRIKKEAE